jgi:4-hydroxybenzoate polyprenyltransferase
MPADPRLSPPRAAPSISLLHRFRPYAQLVRLPNVFTAFADICLGALATHALPESWLPFLLLLLASGCLYCAGMVWNDFFDIEQDRRERPQRPIPSGEVPRHKAAQLGAVLLVVGLVCAYLADQVVWRLTADRHPNIDFLSTSLGGNAFWIAVFLTIAILLYDGWLKRTWAGPLGMGLCRFLNVLLGLTVFEVFIPKWGIHLAAVVGIYIVGVTWFARTEARASKRSSLTGAALVMLAGLLIAIPIPTWAVTGDSSPLFPYLLVALGFWVGVPVWRAIEQPSPLLVQAAVKRAIFGLVLLDATLTTALAGSIGLLILLLLLPALYFGKWLYST